jgi:tetratricopeptide (TPR) repeat protein
LDWDSGRAALHPLVRHELLSRAKDSRRWESNHPWRLAKADRLAVHDRLKTEYRLVDTAPLRDSVESLHHELLGTSPHLDELDVRVRFVEQLHEVGRTLSYVHHEHQRAVELFRLALRFDPGHPYSHHYLAFNLDWLAVEADEVENHYQEAIRLQPTHPWYWSRWISYLATRGRFGEAKSKWRDAVNSLSIDEGSPDWIFLSLHTWVARWLLHWAELDFAEEVLRGIPRELAENEASIQTLWDLLEALRQARRGVSVFPLTVPAKEWWSPSPHTDLPPRWEDHPLHSWIPARVDGVDRNTSIAFLVGAKRPASKHADPEYFEMELSRDEVAKAADGFGWDDLCEGRFVELGYYGDGNDLLRIGLHRDTEWRDPHLLSLVPPPDRWYRRAVDSAWASMDEDETY